MSRTIDEMRELVRQQYGEGIPERVHREQETRKPATNYHLRTPGAPRHRCQGVPTEHDIQVELFGRINDPAQQREHPELALCFAIPNGLTDAARPPPTSP